MANEILQILNRGPFTFQLNGFLRCTLKYYKKYFNSCLETLYFGSEVDGLFSRLAFLLFENGLAKKYSDVKFSLNSSTIKSRNSFTHAGH